MRRVAVGGGGGVSEVGEGVRWAEKGRLAWNGGSGGKGRVGIRGETYGLI